jgi:calcium-dependent protein kinase
MVRFLLNTDPNERPSADEALQHPWLQIHYHNGNLTQHDLSDALQNIQEFTAGTRLKQGVLAFFSKFLLTAKEKDKLTEEFRAIDVNGDGIITREELIMAYRKYRGENFNIEEVDEIIKNVD